MKRIVLFSTLTKSNRRTILRQIFPEELQDKVFSYIPSSGVEGAEQYIEEWRKIAQAHKAEFNVIDNSLNDLKQQMTLLSSNIVVISGGNTFNLLRNLRQSGLDESIKEFAKKRNFILAGFSAGALILTPSITICTLPDFDENLVGISDLSGLGIVDYEIFPHYEEKVHKTVLDTYRKTTTNRVIGITDEDYIAIDG